MTDLKAINRYYHIEKTQLTDDDPEYQLIVDANELAVDINNEITDIHKFIRDIYSVRFPELEGLVFHSLDYARTVLTLQNDLSQVVKLGEILPASNIITISMAASSSTGKLLDEAQLDHAIKACEITLSLDEFRKRILDYVERRMKIFAPNLSALLGTEIAAKLIGAAGGKKRRALDGFSAATAVRHQGYIQECTLVQDAPKDLESKTCRVLANKCSLIARIDLQHDSYLDGSQGLRVRDEIEEKLNKWLEPPPARKVRVLARPDANAGRTKRGGEKLRRHKEKFHVTEMRKRANRMLFGKVQEEYGNSMKTLGMLDMEGSGVLRATVAEQKGFKIKAKSWAKGKKAGDKTSMPGYATSAFAMTPMQGMELVNPVAQTEKTIEDSQSYFSTSSSFINLKK